MWGKWSPCGYVTTLLPCWRSLRLDADNRPGFVFRGRWCCSSPRNLPHAYWNMLFAAICDSLTIRGKLVETSNWLGQNEEENLEFLGRTAESRAASWSHLCACHRCLCTGRHPVNSVFSSNCHSSGVVGCLISNLHSDCDTCQTTRGFQAQKQLDQFLSLSVKEKNTTRDLAPKANVLRCHHRHTPQWKGGGWHFPWGGGFDFGP